MMMMTLTTILDFAHFMKSDARMTDLVCALREGSDKENHDCHDITIPFCVASHKTQKYQGRIRGRPSRGPCDQEVAKNPRNSLHHRIESSGNPG